MRRMHHWLWVLVGCAVALPLRSQQAIPGPTREAAAALKAEAGPVALSAADFLAAARRPFLENVWCRFTGDVQFRGANRELKVPIRVAMRLTPKCLFTEVALPDNQVYHVEQTYAADGVSLPEVKLRQPATKGALRLEELGLQPEDIAFCFLYWKILAELPAEDVRGQPCRVLDLQPPDKPGKVRAWMSRDYGFPLRVSWYRAGEEKPLRTFESKDFKRHGEFWFPKGMILTGENWKSRVTFDEADVYRPEEQPEPTHLFQVPNAPEVPAK